MKGPNRFSEKLELFYEKNLNAIIIRFSRSLLRSEPVVNIHKIVGKRPKLAYFIKPAKRLNNAQNTKRIYETEKNFKNMNAI